MWRSAVGEEREWYWGAQGVTLLARAIASD
jgi:hypothetical protein